ncbi:MAG: hypothetical protein ACREJO_07825 [Phycisphaerales bacterium]
MTPPPAHAATVAGAAGAPQAARPVCPECGCPSGSDRPPAAFAPRWPRLTPRYALIAALLLVLSVSIFTDRTSGGSMGYGGWGQPKWPNPSVVELREVANGRRDGATLASGALAAVADFRRQWHPDSTMCIQAVAPMRWGYWSEDGFGWPLAWWWHICYPDDGKTGRHYTGGWHWDGETLQVPWFDHNDASEHAAHIHPFNIFLSIWCVAAVWLAACWVMRRSLRPSERWLMLAVFALVALKLGSNPARTFGTVRRDYVALERWPDAQSPIKGPELALVELETAAADPTGRALAAALLGSTSDPDNDMVRWQLIPMTRAWGSFAQHHVGWPWPLIETYQHTSPAPTTGVPNTKPVEQHWVWWRGPQYCWGSTGFPSSNTSLSLPLGALALHTTLLGAVWWCTRLITRRVAAFIYARRFRAGHCVACSYPVSPPVLVGAPHQISSLLRPHTHR